MYEAGIAGMRYSISDTAQYGDMTRGPRLIDESVRARMKEILKEVQGGQFAREWILENKANRPVFRALAAQDQNHQIEQVGQRLRGMMSWVKPAVAAQQEEQKLNHRVQNLEFRE
jgi:ketol-acid reductoisomerase